MEDELVWNLRSTYHDDVPICTQFSYVAYSIGQGRIHIEYSCNGTGLSAGLDVDVDVECQPKEHETQRCLDVIGYVTKQGYLEMDNVELVSHGNPSACSVDKKDLIRLGILNAE